MPDVKISALPAATVPLAGTEVLPIVQSATTRQVSVANLTAGRAISASSVTNSALTSGRVTYAGASGLLTDSANLTFDGTTLNTIGITTTGNTILGNASSDTLNVANGDLIKDAAGNLGVGVTPSASDSVFKVLDVGQAGNGISGNSGTTQITQGVYYNSGYKYSVTGTAVGRYEINTGVHKWNIAASGTAGNAISFTQAMTLDASGNLLVGKTALNSTTTGIQLQSDGTGLFTVNSTSSGVNGLSLVSSSASTYQFYVSMDGVVHAVNTVISAISDQRLKENVTDLDVGLNAIMSLKPRKFDWKEGKGKDIKGDRGFIAQEFEQVFPDLIDEWKDFVPEGKEPYKSVRQDLVPVLVKAIQEQQALIELLTTRLTELENK